MKIKIDYITNSSSASFTIPSSCLTEKQISMIVNHIELASAIAEDYDGDLFLDEWTIEDKKHSVEGYTSMDNFDMTWFLSNIVKVDPECIQFEGSNY